jgi:hypothetical protein
LQYHSFANFVTLTFLISFFFNVKAMFILSDSIPSDMPSSQRTVP